MPLVSMLLRIAIASGSIVGVIRRGERGQPCLVPRCRLEKADRLLLVGTAAIGIGYGVSIHHINYSYYSNYRKGTPTPPDQRLFAASRDIIPQCLWLEWDHKGH